VVAFGNISDDKLARTEDRPMARSYWFDPFEEMERFFDDPWFFPRAKAIARPRLRVGVPNVDISDEVDHIRIRADMPGVPKENVEVHVDEDVLEIKAHLDETQEETGGNFIRRERRTSSFQRSFVLPDSVDKEAIKANMKYGVLNIQIPKVEPKEPKKVPINVD
jgi:HSP20 family protein